MSYEDADKTKKEKFTIARAVERQVAYDYGYREKIYNLY